MERLGFLSRAHSTWRVDHTWRLIPHGVLITLLCFNRTLCVDSRLRMAVRGVSVSVDTGITHARELGQPVVSCHCVAVCLFTHCAQLQATIPQ